MPEAVKPTMWPQLEPQASGYGDKDDMPTGYVDWRPATQAKVVSLEGQRSVLLHQMNYWHNYITDT